ncbi:CRTAC1 family protein [Nibricoccus sp. IMCC34717]|uniref:CRTAC1 family protein n=1 Tax=Nibricoccus sp. IMCC34717 TaxID=3034021 RepID=UPI00384C0534
MPTPPSAPRRDNRLPPSATSPLWRLWLPLVLASVASGIGFARWGGQWGRDAQEPRLRFSEASREAGLTHDAAGPTGTDTTGPSTLGCGAAVFDADGDRNLDAYLVGKFYRNLGGGHFVDQTNASGLATSFVGMSAAAGDFDRDGLPDLALTGVGTVAVYRNLGGGRFAPLGPEAGLPSDEPRWFAGATWLDVNRDGWLDLIVATYARWPRDLPLDEAIAVTAGGRSYGTPVGLGAGEPAVFLNRGNGTFSAAPDAAGLDTFSRASSGPQPWAMAALPLNANDDLLPDLLLTFAEGPPLLFVGRAEGGFKRLAIGSEVRREGDALLNALQVAEPLGASRDPRSRALLRAAAGYFQPEPGAFTDWPALADIDHDGMPEAIVTGSPLEPHPAPGVALTLRPALPAFARESGGSWRLRPLPLVEAAAELVPSLGRFVIAADLDNDGDDDLLITRFGEAPWVLRNEAPTGIPWLAVDLRAAPGGAVPYGAQVSLVTPRGTTTQTWLPVHNGLGQTLGPLRFGLGRDSRVRRVWVRWPGGGETEIAEPGLNRVLVLTAPPGP